MTQLVATHTAGLRDRPQWMTGAREWIMGIANRADALLRAREVSAALQMAARLNYADPIITEGRLLLIEIYRRALALDPEVRIPSHYATAARCSATTWAKVQTAALAYVTTSGEAPSWSWLGRAANNLAHTPNVEPGEYAARSHEQHEADRATARRKAAAKASFDERARGLTLDELVDHARRLMTDTDEPVTVPDLYELASVAARHAAFAEAILRRVDRDNAGGYLPRIDVLGGVVLVLADEVSGA